LIWQFSVRQRLERLPIPADDQKPPEPGQTVPALPAINSGVEMFVLDDGDDSWRKLNARFTNGRPGGTRPWRRCLAVLRHHKARTAVLEPHYVCLDYRSEFSAFYAHLDAPRRSSTVRLHFFEDTLDRADLADLGDKAAGYLGYIVCREGDLPLVGRTVLRVPAYVDTSTAVSEPVNFLGQALQVHGVPFMQQDENFALCAHVAAWITHYSAHRRRLLERRLIADFVAVAGTAQPIRPRLSSGLNVNQVGELYERLGFRAQTYSTPLAKHPTIPPAEDLDCVLDLPPGDPDAIGEAAAEIVDASLAHLLEPYLESGWPAYAQLADHAVVVCGRAVRDSVTVHFIHDDQNGPYLPVPSLSRLSRRELRELVAPSGPDADDVPRDYVNALVHSSALAEGLGDDMSDGVRELVVPVPARNLLSPYLAGADADFFAKNLAQETFPLLLDASLRETLTACRPRVRMMMGIDYKKQRCRTMREAGDQAGLAAYGSVALAEWVVVTEGVGRLADGQPGSHWEIVYDATSGQATPRRHLVRVLDSVFAPQPGHPDVYARSDLASSTLPTISVPRDLTKYVGGSDEGTASWRPTATKDGRHSSSGA
jgi:hypothetical protein